MVGKRDFMAPELLKLTDHQGYGPKVDIWSIGVFMHLIFYGYLPKIFGIQAGK